MLTTVFDAQKWQAVQATNKVGYSTNTTIRLLAILNATTCILGSVDPLAHLWIDQKIVGGCVLKAEELNCDVAINGRETTC